MSSIFGQPYGRNGLWVPAWRIAGLAFIAYPVVRIVLRPPEPLIAVLALAATAIFAFLVWALGRRDPNDARRRSLGLAALDVVMLGLAAAIARLSNDGSWVALFYFAATAASLLLPERRAVGLIIVSGVVTALTVGTMDEAASAVIQGLSVSVIGITVFSMAAVRRTNAQLYAAREELALLAVAEERDRIARDLHDVLGHSLSLIAIKSELAGRLLPAEPERARVEIADVERVARDSLASVRDTVAGYRQPTLERELENARLVLEAGDVETTIEHGAGPLPAAVGTVLAWAVREGVTNVVRHSDARRVTIRTSRSEDGAAIEVVDDGIGGGAAGARTDPNGTGLRGLRERLAGAGGGLEAGPLAGGGYRLRATVPIGAAAQARPAPAAASAPVPRLP